MLLECGKVGVNAVEEKAVEQLFVPSFASVKFVWLLPAIFAARNFYSLYIFLHGSFQIWWCQH
jgi:hypothetical protein